MASTSEPEAKTPATPPGATRNTLDTVTTSGTAANGSPRASRNGSVIAVSFESLRHDALVQAFIKRADAQLGILGYT